MTRWLALLGATLCEVTATLALRAAVDAPPWYALTTIGYLGAFALLAVTLEAGMPMGLAYGLWAATGVALTATLAVPLFGEHLGGTMLLGIGFIVVGVLLVEVGSQRTTRARGGAAVEEVTC